MSKNEEILSKKRAIELYDKGLLKEFEVGTFKGLSQIHEYLFKDIFDFAGKIRTENISKGLFRFASALYLEESLAVIEKMPEEKFDQIIEKYVEMNICHPFREGNGRSMRIWLDQILKKQLGSCIDWAKVYKEDYLSAMERSPINSLEIKYLLKEALTEECNNREVYMRGIQRSYEYEDLDEYDIEEIK